MTKKTNSDSKNNTVNFYSRLSKEIFTVLEDEALSKNISVNSLVNNILGKYVDQAAHILGIEV